MPAIQLAKLKIEVAHLAEKFHEPAKFVRDLHELCDIYAERTRRPGQAGEPPPLLATYKVPAPVLRQVMKELRLYIDVDNPAALNLADALWEVAYLEFRLLAASILGLVSPKPVENVLERVKTWSNPNTDDRLLTALVEDGLAKVREQETEIYLNLIKTWLEAEDIFCQRLGLRAVLYLLKSQDFENLPVTMRLVTPLIRSAPARLRPDIIDVVQVLANRSPKETAYFLRQNLGLSSDNPGTAWIIRNSLRFFQVEAQNSLRQALRSEI